MQDGRARAFFLNANATQATIAWVGIVANLSLISFGGAWLWQHLSLMATRSWILIPTTIAALFFADFFSGFVHWATDTWFDERVGGRVIAIAREHHLFPHHIVHYGFRDYVAYSSWPTVFVFAPILVAPALASQPGIAAYGLAWFVTVIALIMLFGTHAHRLGHRRSTSKLVRLLQQANLLMSPQHHMVHHSNNHDRRYCVINGWANYVCDGLGIWRVFERFVQLVFGAIPRAHDHHCFAEFRRDHSFLTGSRFYYRLAASAKPSRLA